MFFGEVVLFFRKAKPENFSIERSFSAVLPHLTASRTAIFTFGRVSRGLFNRLYILAQAWYQSLKRPRAVLHLTGELHFAALLMPPKRSIVTIHDCYFMHLYRGWALKIVAFFWLYAPVRRVRYLTTVSAETKREIIHFTACNPDKIAVIPTCIADGFRPVPKPFNAQCPEILQVGTKPNKNLETLAEALGGFSCRLHIVGSLSAAQRQILARYGIVYRVSQNLSNTDMLQAYADCDLLAFVSLAEGFGMPIVEAQATGRVVLTSCCSAMPDTAGGGALLVNPHDPQAIRAGIAQLCADANLRNALITNGYTNAEKYRPAVVAAQYQALYQHVHDRL